MKQSIKAALYMRLSRDDANFGDSISIETQRTILRKFATDNALLVVDEYVDDGWSGTNFERPNFKRMIADIEVGKINCVVTKDLSRFGREHIMMGYYLEFFFPEHQVRYIAVTENEDSEKGLSDFVPFKNLFNEWYAKDTSRKVKAAIHARHASGEHTCAYAPLGYKKDPENRNHLIIDEETSWIIKKIFNLASHGVGSSRIARVLIEEHIPTAGYFNYRRYGSFANIYAGQPEEKAWAWSIVQIRNILKDETYIGNSVHNKQAHVSYKNKKLIRTPSEEWFRVENTHEAIIDKDEFYQVQQQIANRRRQMKTATTQIFSGLMKCADCGLSMSYGRNNITKNPFSYFTCTRYRQISSVNKCTAHYIRYDKLYETVLARLRYWMKFATENREQLISQLTAKLSNGAQSATTDLKTQLSQAEKRKSDVDRMFFKVYEDWSSGRISEYNYTMLSEKYQAEQETLDDKIKQLSEQLDSEKQSENGAEKWVDLLVRYEMPSELNAEILNALIEKIIIHESVKSDKGKTQEIEIIYRFVGKID